MSRPDRHAYEFGPFRLSPAEGRLLREGNPVTLTPKAFEALVLLVGNTYGNTQLESRARAEELEFLKGPGSSF